MLSLRTPRGTSPAVRESYCPTLLLLFHCESVYLVGPRIAKQKRRIGRVKTQPTTGVPPHISKFLQINNPILVAAGQMRDGMFYPLRGRPTYWPALPVTFKKRNLDGHLAWRRRRAS